MWTYLQDLGGGSQLRYGVVVRQQVGQLAVRVQRRQGGQRLLQIADPLLAALEHREGGRETCLVNTKTCLKYSFLSFCYLSVPVVLGEAPPHHVSHTQSLHPQQVEDHGVGESELGLQDGGFTLRIRQSC